MSDQENVKVESVRRAQPEIEDTYVPAVDVYEQDDNTIMVADMPGVGVGNVKVEVDKGVLTISGTTCWDPPSDDYSRTFVDFSAGEFFRAFALSDEVDRESIVASISDGVLTVTLPKAESAKTRRIEIKAE